MFFIEDDVDLENYIQNTQRIPANMLVSGERMPNNGNPSLDKTSGSGTLKFGATTELN